MSEWHWKKWREFTRGSDLKAAQQVEAQFIARAAEGTVHPELARELVRLERDLSQALRLGRFREGPRRDQDLLVALQDLLTHLLATGVSGSGKTYFLILLMLAELRHQMVDSLTVLDMKGELAELMTEIVLPALAASLPPQEADALLQRVVIIDPFEGKYLPPLNVLVRDPGVPIAIQARDVAECFEAAIGTDVTARMETILDWVLRLVIETKGSFLTVRRALQEPAVLEGLVRLSKDKEVIRYFLTRFPSEPKASKLALLARLDRFLALPMTQLSLGARFCLDFDTLLQTRIVIVSLGNAPAGLKSVAKFFAMVVMTRFVRAIFRLPSRNRGFNALLVADEWQAALTSALAADFESILTQARSRGVHLWLANQQLSQLDGYGSALRSIVLGETGAQVFFRLAPDDAKALKNLFPATGTWRRQAAGAGSNAPFLSPNEELEARAAAATKAPNRTGYWCDKRKAWSAIPFMSATLQLPPSSSLPRDYVKRAKEGTVKLSVQDLERMRDEEDARLDQLAAGPVRAPAPPVAATTPASPLPGVSTPPSTPTPLQSATPAQAPRKPKGGRLPRIR